MVDLSSPTPPLESKQEIRPPPPTPAISAPLVNNPGPNALPPSPPINGSCKSDSPSPQDSTTPDSDNEDEYLGRKTLHPSDPTDDHPGRNTPPPSNPEDDYPGRKTPPSDSEDDPLSDKEDKVPVDRECEAESCVE